MLQKLKDPVSVILSYDSLKRSVRPTSVKWSGRTYPIIKLGLHHKYRQGTTLFHVFSVISTNLFFKLTLNTDNLHWILSEVSDGLPD